MTGNGYDVVGSVPGSVYSFLHIDNVILPDPYYRDNEKIYLEIAEHEYKFERTFVYDKKETPVFLVCEGLDTLCSIYLNGVHVADTDNMHVCYEFAVEKYLQEGENVIEIVCHAINPYIKSKSATGRLFGATDCMEGYPYVRKAHCMMGWDWGPRLPDTGIWKTIYLKENFDGEIIDVEFLQRHDNERVFVMPKIKTTGAGTSTIQLFAPNGIVVNLENDVETEVKSPLLWWPNGLGEQNLYTLSVKLVLDGKIVDARVLKIGLRELKLVRKSDEWGESFYHEVNGVPVFAKGADYIPEDNILSRITPERTRTLLEQCKACNFNAIRLWGGGFYPDDFFFEICDELGLIVFVDLMFACSLYDPDENMLQSIEAEVRQNILRIRHHACIGLICGNNEIEWHFDEYFELSGRTEYEHFKNMYVYLFESLFPNLIKEVAPYLAYIPSSPTSGGGFVDPNGQNKGDCHDWSSNYLACRNTYYRYMSEFGFAALPSIKTVKAFAVEEDRNPNSKIMNIHQRNSGVNAQLAEMLSKMFLYPTSFESYIYATQALQADIIRYQVEHYRRNRGRCMGTLYWQLNDIWPVTSWASIDYFGRWKALQYASKRFYSPVLLSCEEVGEVQTRPFVNTEDCAYSKEKSATLYVTNDTLSTIHGVIEWKLCDSYSNVLKSGEEEVFVDKLSVKKMNKLNFSDMDAEIVHFTYALIIDGVAVSNGSVLFTQPKYYRFVNPKLKYVIENGEIVITSEAYAKGVMIEDEQNDLILEDNFFDMEKGERRIKILSGKPTTLIVRSVCNIC